MVETSSKKKRQTILFTSRLNGKEPLVNPTYTPNVSTIKDQTWPEFLLYLKKHKEQLQINMEWEEFYYRINHVKAMYKQIMEFDENLRSKKINQMIKDSIPNYKILKSNLCEFSRWKRFYKLTVLLIEDPVLKEKNIPLEFCFQKFSGLGLTVNYLYEVDEEEYKIFLKNFVECCVEMYKEILGVKILG
ncbi:7248_t:CDS:1 [Dentiscutata erythropus]|uniref:7248_t:CDS:1 n=1 Tax=Dentiscutata erythropus TaxID=1348616 RepID=A0A9N8V855_9GLOM|nr:7248_t:CDS:1 [Dentiscutata erythropus]